MNNLLSLYLKFSKNLATKQIKSLGNLIGDTLWLLEVEMIKKSDNKFYVQKINMLINLYAEQFDELLVKQETGMLEDIGNLFKLLLSDLERIKIIT
ncbi:MAG: hypothetical protein EBY20_04940 [Alphaproteobacteria bacterium]|jgi:hypothetical protein|nr:hypothetical protein [Alphaproteobacteria bacterium]